MCQVELSARSGFVPLVATERLTLLHPDVLWHHRNNLAPFMLKRAVLIRWISPVNKSVVSIWQFCCCVIAPLNVFCLVGFFLDRV